MASTAAVQFRGLSSRYSPNESAKVSFRYAAGGEFTAAEDDKVGIFPETASTLEEKLVLVDLADPSSHHFCDGGLYKTSSVNIDLKAIEGGEARFQFWYISSKTGKVEGKSDSFTVCSDENDCASMSLSSTDDQTLLKGFHTQSSPTIDEGLKSNTSTLGSSFILVSEEDSHNMSGSEYVMAELDSKLEEGPKMEEERIDPKMEVGSLGQGSEVMHMDEITNSRSNSTSERNGSSETSGRTKSDEMVDQRATHLVNDYVICPSLETSTSPEETTKEEELLRLETATPIAVELPTAEDPSKTPSKFESEAKAEFPNASKPSDILKPRDDPAWISTPCGDSDAMSALLPPLLSDITDLSSSTVVIEKHVTQREARSLKSSNKELRLKIHKLSEILEDKKLVIAQLTDSLKGKEVNLHEKDTILAEIGCERAEFELERKNWEQREAVLKEQLIELSERNEELQSKLQTSMGEFQNLEDSRKMIESLNKKLLIEKSALEEKIQQLTQENKTIFERSSKLLTQLQDSETKREIERSEKQVLQVKIDYLHSELRKMTHTRQEMVSGLQKRLHNSQDKVRQEYVAKPSMLPNTRVPGISKQELTSLPPQTSSNNNSSMPSLSQSQLRPNQLPIQGLRSSIPPPSSKTNGIVATKPPRIVANEQQQSKVVNAQPPRVMNGKNFGEASSIVEEPVRYRNHHLPPNPEGAPLRRQFNDHQRFQPPMNSHLMPPPQAGQERPNASSSTLVAPAIQRRHSSAETRPQRFMQGGRVMGPSRDQEEAISERRIEALASQLDKRGVAAVECPICGKILHSRENDFSILLHVEHCIQLSEEQNNQ